MDLIKRLLHKKLVLAGITIVIIGGGYYGYKAVKGSNTPVQYKTAAVTKGTITSSVSGTGQVAATSQVDVKPSTTGKITSVQVKQGDQVKSGQTLVTIDSRTAVAQLAQARASLAQAQASYDKAVNGTTGSSLTSYQNAVVNAKQALDDAKANLPVVTTQQNRAVATAQSNMLNAGLTATPAITNTSTATVTITGSYTGTDQGQYTLSFQDGSSYTYYHYFGLENGGTGIQRGDTKQLGTHGLFFTVSSTGTIVAGDSWTINLPNLQASNYYSLKNSYDSAVENRTISIQQAQDTITKDQLAYDQAQQTLTEQLSPADKATLLSAQASVSQAQASLISAQTNLSNTVITAPFDGVVASLSAQKGDDASTATALATITTKQQVAEVTLNEVDVAKVKLGQKATLTFSAVDGLTVTGEVGEVDLIGTVTQNVVSFKVKIVFDTQDDRIKPGMSVTAAIITDIKQDVLIVPSSAVKTNGNQNYVETLVNNVPVQHQVTTGLSNDTDIEVSGDIKEGDEVITQTISSTAPKTTQSSASIIPGLGGGGTRGAGAGGGAAFGGGAAAGR